MISVKEEYDNIFQIFLEHEEQIIRDIKSSKYPLTFKSIYYKIKAIDQLVLALESCIDNNYSSQVLTRALLEHYLIGYYIYVKNENIKTDAIGEEYYKNYTCSEFFKRKTYSIQIENIRKGVTQKVNMDTIKELYPEFDFMSQQDLQDVHSKSRQFMDMKWMGQYLVENGGTKKSLEVLHVVMLEFLDRYNILSSYIHGGPSAESNCFYPNSGNPETGISSPEENIEWGQLASKSLKVYFIFGLGYQYPEKYMEIVDEMMKWV
ncbi:hypothetical protein [Zobellia sp. B3R18]|uniref:hypothetical protein n=1 Tax=Zobellia sp. B3R18 TaxID=2841568 RepID=UPI001C07ECF7|nr:hypothetical protein [Zobellia sp. B3R18]MBU2973454.1 hypothetical protein [Zobellia sp. B3R18]